MASISSSKNLTVVIPVYNEGKTLAKVLRKVLKQPLVREVIVVNDASTDDTAEVLKQFEDKVKVLINRENRGKGYSVRKAMKQATSKYVIVQDADLEYNPADYTVLMRRMSATGADIVNGVRKFTGPNIHPLTRLGSTVIPSVTFILFGKWAKDIVSCYKLMRKKTWDELGLRSDRFELETELIVKAIQKKIKIEEVEIRYNPRSRKEGKHVGIKDGIKVIGMLFRMKSRTDRIKHS